MSPVFLGAYRGETNVWGIFLHVSGINFCVSGRYASLYVGRTLRSVVQTNGVRARVGSRAGSRANVFYTHNGARDVFTSVLYG